MSEDLQAKESTQQVVRPPMSSVADTVASTGAPKSFSWSQVVRKDKGAAPHAPPAHASAAGGKLAQQQSSDDQLAVSKVQEKMGKNLTLQRKHSGIDEKTAAPSGQEGQPQAQVGNRLEKTLQQKPQQVARATGSHEHTNHSSSQGSEGGSSAHDTISQGQSLGVEGSVGGGSAPAGAGGLSEAPVAALKPLKSAWVGSGASGGKNGEAGSSVNSPTAVSVLSTSSQSWPTLGDSKTEPQKRGLTLQQLEAAAQQINMNTSSTSTGGGGKNGDGNGNGSNKRGNKRGSNSGGSRGGGGGDYSNNNHHRGTGSNTGNNAGVSGSSNRRGNRQNGKGGGNNNQSDSTNQNGWVAGGSGNSTSSNRGHRNRNNNQSSNRTNSSSQNGNHSQNQGSNSQMNGTKGGMNQQQQQQHGANMNGVGGAGPGQGSQQPAGFYMPMYYSPMPNAGPGGPMYMMPPAQPMVGGASVSSQQAGGSLPQGQQASQAKDSILEAVKVQVEYYFSVQNLVKDMFLRAKMDENGWIPIGVIAAFNRVRALAPNPSMIAAALEGSALVEVSQNQESIRVRDSWQSWVLPEDRRDPQTKRHQSSPGSPVPVGGVPGGINMASMFPCTEVPDQMLDRLVLVGRIASGDLVKDSEALMITSEVAAMVNNGIAVLESQLRSQSESLDTLPIVSNHFYPIAPMLSQQQPNPKDPSQMPLVAPSAFGSHIGWMFVNSSVQASSESTSEDQESPVGDKQVVKHSEIKNFGHPAYTYFKANNYVQVKYKDFRDCCMNKKKKNVDESGQVPTHPPEMYTLYQFWGLFLRDVFNTAMYEDFKQSALADHAKGLGFGVTCLFGLYHNRLLKEFRPGLLKDMEQLQQQLQQQK